MSASLGRDDDVDGKMFACGAELALQSSRIADAALRVVDETDELGAPSSIPIALEVGAYLICELLPAESRPSFLHDDGQAIVIEKKCCAGNAVGVGRDPLIRADVIKKLTKERMHEVLYIAFIFDIDRRTVLAAQA